MAKITIFRLKQNEFQTTGILWVKPFFFCRTLELPWKNNQRNVSCIPPGVYPAQKYLSISKDQWVVQIKNVPGRSGIQIHSGNTYRDIKGCIIVGIGEKDIDNDGIIDVIKSKKTMGKLLKKLPDEFTIKILDI